MSDLAGVSDVVDVALHGSHSYRLAPPVPSPINAQARIAQQHAATLQAVYDQLARAKAELADMHARALDTVIAMFANPSTHGERVTLAQLKAKREALR